MPPTPDPIREESPRPAEADAVGVWGPGLKEKCVDSLVFETLIPKPMMQHYIGLLLKHRRLVLSGPSGTGKTYLTNRLAEYLVERSGREVTEGIVSTFNMHQQSCKVAALCPHWPSPPPPSSPSLLQEHLALQVPTAPPSPLLPTLPSASLVRPFFSLASFPLPFFPGLRSELSVTMEFLLWLSS